MDSLDALSHSSGIEEYLDAKNRSQIYSKLILTDCIVLSKSDVAVTLKHMTKMAKLRDQAVADQLLVKGDWFASKSVKGNITLQTGYLKAHPGNSTQARSDFANLLASYAVNFDDFERSFAKDKIGIIPRTLGMTDITRTSWLYSKQLEDAISKNDFLCKRVNLDPSTVMVDFLGKESLCQRKPKQLSLSD